MTTRTWVSIGLVLEISSATAFAQAPDALPPELAEEELGHVAEAPDRPYLFLGATYRHVFIPGFLLEIGVDAAPSANNPAVGIDFTYRVDGFSIVASVFWMNGSVEGPFRSSGDPDVDTEWLDSSLQGIFASATILWSTPIWKDYIAFEYGVGLGIGVVYGDLVRTEAEPADGGGYRPCDGPLTGNVNYCAATSSGGPTDPDGVDGEHYGVVAESWVGGGSVPNVVPWLALPHLAVRFKPIRPLVMKIEGGLGFGFFVGASAAYGF